MCPEKEARFAQTQAFWQSPLIRFPRSSKKIHQFPTKKLYNKINQQIRKSWSWNINNSCVEHDCVHPSVRDLSKSAIKVKPHLNKKMVFFSRSSRSRLEHLKNLPINNCWTKSDNSAGIPRTSPSWSIAKSMIFLQWPLERSNQRQWPEVFRPQLSWCSSRYTPRST